MTQYLAPNDLRSLVGVIETLGDAITVISAARPKAHQLDPFIQSGSVFIFSKEESHIYRWVDGRSWGPSRIVGGFTEYQELAIVDKAVLDTGGISEDMYTSIPSNSRLRSTQNGDSLIKRVIVVPFTDGEWQLVSYYAPKDITLRILSRPIVLPDIMRLPIPENEIIWSSIRGRSKGLRVTDLEMSTGLRSMSSNHRRIRKEETNRTKDHHSSIAVTSSRYNVSRIYQNYPTWATVPRDIKTAILLWDDFDTFTS